MIGFLDYKREEPKTRKIEDRLKDYNELYKSFSNKQVQKQSERCMDCGTPFCHNACPLGNNIPEFNEEVRKGNWEGAYLVLSATNNLPEITGRICPALCEASCVLGLINPQVTIQNAEKTIIEKAFKENFVASEIIEKRSNNKIAIVGSGPAGLSAAIQLNKAGHNVTIFERDDKAGGLLRYGIPDFKLEKSVIDRRIEIMKQSGINFKINVNVGEDISASELKDNFDIILLTGGSTVPRNVNIKGRNLNGIHYAMDFLKQQNKENARIKVENKILAENKTVVVIGGGDTGSDCVGTSNRQKAKSIIQIELLDKPPINRAENNPWPEWWNVLKTTSSHNEGCSRKWNILTKEFIGDNKNNLKAIKVVDIKWDNKKFSEIKNSEREIVCDMALLAVGFLHPQHNGILEQLNIELDEQGNVKTDNYRTNCDKIYAAGDMRIGQSLVVNAIAEGIEVANYIDRKLNKNSILETTDSSIIGV